MSFAPPVSRDGFHYNGDLYVEVGNLNRHKRSSVPEITQILRPDLKKGKTTLAAQNKDPVGHWYEAQLIHYGLPPSKDKARAKMRLLEALNASTLVVPPKIITLEASLRKQYEAADRKAKAQYKAGLSTVEHKPEVSKKRKQPDPSPSNGTTVNVNLNFGSFGGMDLAGHNFEHMAHQQADSPTQTAKRVRATAPKSPKPKAVGKSSDMIAGSKSTVATGKNASSLAKGSRKGPDVSKSPVAKRKTPTAQKEPPKKEPVVKKEAAVKKEPAVKKESVVKKEPAVKEQRVKKETGVQQEPGIKREAKVKSEPAETSQPALGLINGIYDISCPYLEEQFDHADMSLILCLDTPQVWGAYDFGSFEGILNLPQRPYQPSEHGLLFHWRGRENGEGEMSFGEDCHGELAFLGGGRIAGRLNVFGNCEFTGMKRYGPTVSPRSAYSMRQEWDGYNRDAYEAARVGRWG
jgi:hypothetical protein